jgi:ribosomal protein S18 acetylase RimI-like enzyme
MPQVQSHPAGSGFSRFMNVTTRPDLLVTALARSQLTTARQTLIEAFSADPMLAYFFPSAARRASGSVQVFRVTLNHGFYHGVVDVVEDGKGVAIWLRSENADLTFRRMWRVGLPSAGLSIGFRASCRILRFMKWLEERRKESLPEPHWYLLNLAIRPGCQGKGLGSILLAHGLDRARTEATPCYLETSNPRNVAFYERNGFRLVYDAAAPSRGPHLWGFVAR